jgi:hypothetical protein
LDALLDATIHRQVALFSYRNDMMMMMMMILVLFFLEFFFYFFS